MNVFKRGMIFVTFFGCCFAMALMAASLGTKFWFEGEAVQKEPSGTGFRSEASGKIHFGLFKGVKILNWGIGDRTTQFSVSEQVPELMNEGLWIATIIGLAGGLLFAVVGAIFAIINTATTPIEAITGIPGLLAWNLIAAGFSLVAIVCWAVQYHVHMLDNVLIEDAEEGWTTEGLEHLAYSYWLVVVAMCLHMLNCALIYVGTYEKKVKTQYEAPETKPGNSMLY